MSITIAVTFGQKYNHEGHPHLPGVTGQHFLLVEGDTTPDAIDKAFAITKGLHAFDYLYAVDGVLDPEFQRQIGEYGYREYVLTT